MADITTPTQAKNKKHQHKLIRVDLTPMVDLGFLLITFFILTTTMQEQTQMNLVLPKDSPLTTDVPLSKVLTFILNRNDSIGYYEGDSKEIRFERFGAMRNIIQKKQLSLTNTGDKDKMVLIIKPTKESTYKNLIDALDEIRINDCRTYFITEPEKSEVL